jgi:hypothetical protein
MRPAQPKPGIKGHDKYFAIEYFGSGFETGNSRFRYVEKTARNTVLHKYTCDHCLKIDIF